MIGCSLNEPSCSVRRLGICIYMQLLLSIVLSAYRCCDIPHARCTTCYNSTAHRENATRGDSIGGDSTGGEDYHQDQLRWGILWVGLALFGFVALSICITLLNTYNARFRRGTEAQESQTRLQAAMSRRTFIWQADDHVCAICLSEFESGQTLATLRCCGHCYHEDCIMRWLSGDECQRTCPLCKRDVHMYLAKSTTPVSSPSDTERTDYSSSFSSTRVDPSVETSPMSA